MKQKYLVIELNLVNLSGILARFRLIFAIFLTSLIRPDGTTSFPKQVTLEDINTFRREPSPRIGQGDNLPLPRGPGLRA